MKKSPMLCTCPEDMRCSMGHTMSCVSKIFERMLFEPANLRSYYRPSNISQLRMVSMSDQLSKNRKLLKSFRLV